jgi:hypothetical protein
MGRMMNKYYMEIRAKKQKDKGKKVGRGVRATASTLAPCLVTSSIRAEEKPARCYAVWNS